MRFFDSFGLLALFLSACLGPAAHASSIPPSALAKMFVKPALLCGLRGDTDIIVRSCPSRTCNDVGHFYSGQTVELLCVCNNGESVNGDA